MNTNKYQELAMRTNDGESSIRLLNFQLRQNLQLDVAQIFNGCLGLAGEVGEFNDEVMKMIFHEKEPDEKTFAIRAWRYFMVYCIHLRYFPLGLRLYNEADQLQIRAKIPRRF